jgi:hypothetical protein
VKLRYRLLPRTRMFIAHRLAALLNFLRRRREERCRACREAASRCDCTGGPLVGDPECTCYEPAYGHQPGCAYYGRRA